MNRLGLGDIRRLSGEAGTLPVDHILLTRFNLPSAGAESAIRGRTGWLEQRVRLFESHCLTSVRAQREQNFHWLIYFDPDSPAWLKSWIESTSAGTYTPVFRAEVPPDQLRNDLDSLVPRKSRWLITTNLDNDDGLGRNFTARLRAAHSKIAPSATARTAVYFARGLIMSPDGLYLRTDRHNAFCSVLESWEQPVSCWVDWHNRLPQRMPTVVIGGRPEWLQVVHTSNVSNRVRGRLTSAQPYLDDFIGLDAVPEPSSGRLWLDRLGRTPVRAARDTARTALREAAIATLGKDGLDRAKSRRAQR